MRLASLVADAPPRTSLASRKAITVALRAQRAKRRTITVAMKVVFAAATVGLTAPKWHLTDRLYSVAALSVWRFYQPRDALSRRCQVGSAAGRWQPTRHDDISEPVPWLPLPG
jgi:hypothetical protein